MCSFDLRQQVINDIFTAGKISCAEQVEVVEHMIKLIQFATQRVTGR